MRDMVRRSRSVGPIEMDLPAHGILLRVQRALFERHREIMERAARKRAAERESED